MKKFFPIILIFIFFMAIGCARQDEIITAVTPSVTQIGEKTAVSTPTTTAPPTNTAEPSATTTPLATPTFQPYVTPTFFPVSTPPAPANDFHLKSWDENTAINLVQIANNFANNVYAFTDVWYLKQIDYPKAQSVVEIVSNEALARFPETQLRQNLEWQLAFSEAIQRKPGASARITDLLQKGFDANIYTLENLETVVHQHKFHISSVNPYSTPFPTEAINLFGDNSETSLIYLATDPLAMAPNPQYYGFDEGGIILAISMHDSKPKVHFIDDFWSRGSGAFNKIYVADTTGNGQNEVIIILWDPNCYAHISVMEWKNDQFFDLTRPSEPLPGECRSSWDIGNSSVDERVSLIATTSDILFPTHILTDTYQWNGTEYMHVDRENQIPKEITSQFIMFYGNDFDHQEQLNLYEQLFSGLSEPTNSPKGNYSEMLKFKKAMLHLYLSETKEGLDILQQVADNPNNLIPTAIAQSANVYLETFSSPSDSFQACANALQFLDEALGDDRPEIYEEMEELYFEMWGFSPYYQDEIICDLQTSLEIVVNYWNDSGIAEETAVPDLLEQSGITPFISESIDLDGDGDLDRLLSLELINPGKASNYHLVALITTNEGVALTLIDSRFQNTAPDSFELETSMLSGYPNPIHILHASKRPKIFAFENDSSKLYVREWLDEATLFSLYRFQLSQQNDEFELVAFVDSYLPKFSPN